MDEGRDQAFERATFARITWRLLPLLFAGYVAAFLDRVNVGFAKLQMAGDLHFSDAVYGFGAGIFFLGYFVLEVPSNLALNRIGARIWMARIMFAWGLVSAAFVFVGAMRWGPIAAAYGCSDAQFTFYVLRFLLGAAEAGFFPGVILYLTFWFPADQRARMVALFMSGIGVSNLIGSPISGARRIFRSRMPPPWTPSACSPAPRASSRPSSRRTPSPGRSTSDGSSGRTRRSW